MARFKVLDIRPVLVQRMGIIPTSIITPPYKFFRTFTDYYVWIVLFLFLVSSLLYVLGNFEDFNNVLKTIPMIIGGFQSLGMFMGVGFRSSKIVELREKLQALVDKGDLAFIYYLLCILSYENLTINPLRPEHMRQIIRD